MRISDWSSDVCSSDLLGHHKREMTLRATTFLCLAILTLPAAARAAASSQDPDWPCIQRLVPRIVAAQVWAGPEPDAAAWNDDREIADRKSTRLNSSH